jgi:hypothetical protein
MELILLYIYAYIEGLLGAILVITFFLVALVNLYYRIPRAAFHRGWRWGIAALFPVAGTCLYAVRHWEEVRRPFLFGMFALALGVTLSLLRVQLTCFADVGIDTTTSTVIPGGCYPTFRFP